MNVMDIKKEMTEIGEILDKNTDAAKLQFVSKATGIIAALQDPDQKVPPDVFESFDEEQRRVLVTSFLFVLLQAVQS